jgi:hypothetical protein
MRLAINHQVGESQQRFRVIPVLLPRSKRDSLPASLANTTWAESRGSIGAIAFSRVDVLVFTYSRPSDNAKAFGYAEAPYYQYLTQNVERR